MAYRNGESMRLQSFATINFKPKKILDIGAHTGQFYRWSKSVWPDVPVHMIEANTVHESVLNNLTKNTIDTYTIATLGDSNRDVIFYTRRDKPQTEGASYYKEISYWDIPSLVMPITKTLQTLDTLLTNFQFDLIKIDTQGSEIDILEGGKSIYKLASYIILEVSLIDLNEGAPTYTEVIDYMNCNGFEEIMSIGEHYRDNEVVQKDLVFKNLHI
jgi:FkbM family methyltransferase